MITFEGLSAFHARFLSRWLEALCRCSLGESRRSTTVIKRPGRVQR